MKLAEVMIEFKVSWRFKGRHLCTEGINDFLDLFPIPPSSIVKRFWVQAHDKKANDRIKAKVQKCGCTTSCTLPSITIGKQDVWVDDFKNELEPLIGKTVWLELWYEEEE